MADSDRPKLRSHICGKCGEVWTAHAWDAFRCPCGVLWRKRYFFTARNEFERTAWERSKK